MRPAGGALGAAAAAALAWAALAGVPAAGERFDPRIREMLDRAERGEEPSEEDQRAAARALRDWRLSESTARPGDGRIGRLLENLARGERAEEPLRPLAADLARDYLTAEGLARRLGAGPAGAQARVPGGTELPPGGADPAGHWFLLLACVAILGGGLLVWALGRRRRPDYRAYYS